MEFSEVREYQQGDDIRAIDWNVTARVGEPFVKIFNEERELTVMLVVDASASGTFGSAGQMKGEVGVEISALLAFAAIKNNDRVGLLIFTDEVEVFVPPKKGRKHVLRVIRELLYFRPRGRGTSITTAMQYLDRVSHRRSVAFLISDYQDSDYERALQRIARRHDLIAVSLEDPREAVLPPVGFITLEDAETGEQVVVDSRSDEFRDYFTGQAKARNERRGQFFLKSGIDEIYVDTSISYIEPLVAFFHTRMQRMR